MKKTIITVMLCVNVALLAALILTASERPAYGQVRGADYLVVTGEVGTNYDGIYVLDLATRRMAGLVVDKTTRRFGPIGGGRDLTRDFGKR